MQEVVDIPLCLDSADPEALMKALPRCKQRPMVNSISDEPARWKMLPVLKEHRPKVIALCISESGMPTGVEDRVATASRSSIVLLRRGLPWTISTLTLA